ncbi:hypothetical protein GQR58_028705 [Nymphon striatum]|nr:hypothetical protein GQR58_028705 [Nymphon striatum]
MIPASGYTNTESSISKIRKILGKHVSKEKLQEIIIHLLKTERQQNSRICHISLCSKTCVCIKALLTRQGASYDVAIIEQHNPYGHFLRPLNDDTFLEMIYNECNKNLNTHGGLWNTTNNHKSCKDIMRTQKLGYCHRMAKQTPLRYLMVYSKQLQGDTLAPLLFILALDYAMRKATSNPDQTGFTLHPRRSRRYPKVFRLEAVSFLAEGSASPLELQSMVVPELTIYFNEIENFFKKHTFIYVNFERSTFLYDSLLHGTSINVLSEERIAQVLFVQYSVSQNSITFESKKKKKKLDESSASIKPTPGIFDHDMTVEELSSSTEERIALVERDKEFFDEDGGAPIDGANATTVENSDGAELAANVLGSAQGDRKKSAGVEVGIAKDQVLDSALHDGIKIYVVDTTNKSVRLSYDYLEHIRKVNFESSVFFLNIAGVVE